MDTVVQEGHCDGPACAGVGFAVTLRRSRSRDHQNRLGHWGEAGSSSAAELTRMYYSRHRIHGLNKLHSARHLGHGAKQKLRMLWVRSRKNSYSGRKKRLEPTFSPAAVLTSQGLNQHARCQGWRFWNTDGGTEGGRGTGTLAPRK